MTMNPRRTALILAVALLLRSAPAQALLECTPQGPVEVNIKLDYALPRDDTSLTARQIDEKFRGERSTTLASDSKGIYVGMTESNVEGTFRMQTWQSFNSREDRACVKPRIVDYTIIYHPTVYIAQDFLQVACRFGVTSLHEQRHVDAYLQSINDVIPDMKKAIEDKLNALPKQEPTTQIGMEARREELNQYVRDATKPVFEKFEQVNAPRQAAIDSPEGYAHDEALCPGQYIPAFSR